MRIGQGVVRAATAAVVIAALGCTPSVKHASLERKSPDEVWQREFARAQRFHEGRLFADAERHYLRALDAGRTFPAGDQRVLNTRLALADLYIVLDRDAEAERSYVAVLSEQRRAYGDRNEAVADTLNRLGVLLADQGRAADALPLFEESARTRAMVYGPNHPSTAATVQNLAASYHAVGRLAESETLYVRVLEIYAELGEEYLGVASVAQNNLAGLYRSMGRGGEAESLHLHAIELSTEVNGRGNPNVAIFSRDLAKLMTEQERYREAETEYKRAEQIFRAYYGATSEALRETLADHARMLRAAGRDAEAAELEAAVALIAAELEREQEPAAGAMSGTR